MAAARRAAALDLLDGRRRVLLDSYISTTNKSRGRKGRAQMGKSELASAKKPKGAAGNTGLVSGKAGESGKATSGSGMMEFHKVALLLVLDSPINKAGKLRCVYMKTEDGKLIEIKPYVCIPRTFKRFSGVMLQLLQKLSISAVGLSYSSEKLVSIQKYVAAAENNMDLVFVVGAMAYGKVETNYTDDFVSIWCNCANKKGSFDKMLADGANANAKKKKQKNTASVPGKPL
ncbi:ribosomal RNA small subunit methyltransferase NEP1-like, partial [Rosa sericea]